MTQPANAPFGDSSSPTLPARLGCEDSRILIVDDAQFLGAGLQRVLRSAGFESICATSGEMALELLQTHEIAVVLTDLRMPYMSGEELLTILQKERPALRCIIMTGYATRDIIRRVGQMPNVAGILVKPLEYDRLFSTLARVLDKTDATPAAAPAVSP